MNKSAVLCIIDGMTDECFNLNSLPHMSAMARTGARGFFDALPPGIELESYPCIAALLGVSPASLPPLGRGYVEAVGAGIDVAGDDLILRASWLTLTKEGVLLGPAPPPLTPPTMPEGCEYHSLGDYKALLVLRGEAHLLPQLKTFAPHACAGQKLAAMMPGGEPRLAEVVRLTQHESRVLLPWGQSVPCELPPLGRRAAAVGAVPVFAGLTRAMGLDFRTEPAFNGEISTDLIGKARLALQLAREYPLVVLHINGADEAAHRKNAAQKQAFLQFIDEMVLLPLLVASLPLLVTSDHGASPLNGRHVGGCQPFYLAGTARHGNLGVLPAASALKLLVEEN